MKIDLRMISTLLIVSIFTLTGCMNNNDEQSLQRTGDNQNLELIKLQSAGINDQQAANQAKQIISEYEEVTHVRAVNAGEHLLIAIDVEHFERFELDEIERDLQEKVKKNFSNMKVTLSTDQKILLELEKLENQIETQRIDHDKLEKKVKELVSLSKEQT